MCLLWHVYIVSIDKSQCNLIQQIPKRTLSSRFEFEFEFEFESTLHVIQSEQTNSYKKTYFTLFFLNKLFWKKLSPYGGEIFHWFSCVMFILLYPKWPWFWYCIFIIFNLTFCLLDNDNWQKEKLKDVHLVTLIKEIGPCDNYSLLMLMFATNILKPFYRRYKS